MGLFSFLQRSSATDTPRAGDPVQAARVRARRRLIGAAALLGIGVIGFPLLFETQPRPIPVDIAIDIPKKDGAPPLPLPAPRAASAAPARVSSGVVAERAAEPQRERAPAVARSEPAVDNVRKEAPAARSEPAAPVAKAEPSSDDGARAKALLEGQGAPAAAGAPKPTTVVAAAETKSADAAKSDPAKSDPVKSDAAAAGRFVVQVGAYGEANSARDMRQRVDKLGLKSYTQVVEIDGAKRTRVRVGPFAAREEAEKAAGALKAAGLPAKVLTL